jgi:hypothetical protein
MLQLDSDFDGMAIETSINGKFRVTLMQNATAPPNSKHLNLPLIENEKNCHIEGFAYDNFLNDSWNCVS